MHETPEVRGFVVMVIARLGCDAGVGAPGVFRRLNTPPHWRNNGPLFDVVFRRLNTPCPSQKNRGVQDELFRRLNTTSLLRLLGPFWHQMLE